MIPSVRKTRLIVEAGVAALLVKLGLRLFSFVTLDTALERLGDYYQSGASPALDAAGVYRFGDGAVTGLPGRDSCLVRSLTGRTLLRWYGYDTHLRFGVKRRVKREGGEADIIAHAWLERPDGTRIVQTEGGSEFVRLRSD